jgi:hypothetical protein
MAKKTDVPSAQDYSSGVKKVLILGKDGSNMASVSNPLPVDAVVSVDTMNLTAEMKVDSGNDLYEAENVTRVDDLEVSFDLVSGLTLAKIQSVENKTKGWVYNTKGATVTTTGIELVAANQNTGYPVIEVADEVEVVYRGVSRFDALAKETTLGATNTALGAIETDIEATNTALGTVNTNLGTIETDIEATNTALGTVNTNLGTIETDIEATNTALETIETDIEATNTTLTNGSQLSRAMGIYNVTEPSLSDTDQAQLQLNDKGQLKVTGGASSVTAQYTSPSNFTATYTSSTTLTLSALSGFSITDSSQLVYIKVIPSSGDAAIYVNGSDGVTMTVSSNVVTIAGAGTPFASGDLYEVGINAMPFELDASTQSIKSSSLTNVWNQYTDAEELVDAQDLTDSYADFGAEIDMRGYTHLSVYIITDVNDSENVTLKLLGKHTSAGTDEYELDGGTTQALWTTGASDSKLHYEFNVKGTPFVQLQAIAGTVGGTAGDLSISITKCFKGI